MKDTNFLGVHAFIAKIQWPEKSQFLKSKTTTAIVKINSDNDTIGYLQSGGGLTWVKVLNAGHMVPQDQPRIDKAVEKFVEK